MDSDRWIRLYRLILELKLEVRSLLGASLNPNDWDLRQNREKADDLINKFAQKHTQAMLDEDPDLFFNDFLTVFSIREFTTQQTRTLRKRQNLGDHLVDETATLHEGKERLAKVRKQLETHLEGLVSYWQPYEVTGRADRLAEHKTDLRGFVKRSESMRASLAALHSITVLSAELEECKELWLTGFNEATWLTHIAESEDQST